MRPHPTIPHPLSPELQNVKDILATFPTHEWVMRISLWNSNKLSFMQRNDKSIHVNYDNEWWKLWDFAFLEEILLLINFHLFQTQKIQGINPITETCSYFISVQSRSEANPEGLVSHFPTLVSCGRYWPCHLAVAWTTSHSEFVLKWAFVLPSFLAD